MNRIGDYLWRAAEQAYQYVPPVVKEKATDAYKAIATCLEAPPLEGQEGAGQLIQERSETEGDNCPFLGPNEGKVQKQRRPKTGETDDEKKV